MLALTVPLCDNEQEGGARGESKQAHLAMREHGIFNVLCRCGFESTALRLLVDNLGS